MNAFLGRSYVRGKKLDDWEKGVIAAGIGLLFEFTLFLPPVILVNFWLPLPLNIFYFTAVLFLATCFAILFRFLYGEKKTKTKLAFQKEAKSILNTAVFCFSAATVLICSLAIGVFFYSKFTFLLISFIWGPFVLWTLLCYFLFCGGVFFTWIFILKVSSFDQWKINVNQAFRKHAFRRICLFMIALFMIGFLLPSIDANFALLTPKVFENKPNYSNLMSYGTNFASTLFINSTRQDKRVFSNFSSYVLMENDYKVEVSSIRSLQSVVINNPSNVACKIGNDYFLNPPSLYGIQRFSLNVPNGVTYQPLLKDPSNSSSDIWGILISFDNFAGHFFWVNITYWQEIDLSQNIQIQPYVINIQDLGNGTWMETHTLVIDNSSNSSLWIPYIAYDWLSMGYVIQNSTVVYINGNIQPFDRINGLYELQLDFNTFSQKVTNVTYTILDNAYPSW